MQFKSLIGALLLTLNFNIAHAGSTRVILEPSDGKGLIEVSLTNINGFSNLLFTGFQGTQFPPMNTPLIQLKERASIYLQERQDGYSVERRALLKEGAYVSAFLTVVVGAIIGTVTSDPGSTAKAALLTGAVVGLCYQGIAELSRNRDRNDAVCTRNIVHAVELLQKDAGSRTAKTVVIKTRMSFKNLTNSIADFTQYTK